MDDGATHALWALDQHEVISEGEDTDTDFLLWIWLVYMGAELLFYSMNPSSRISLTISCRLHKMFVGFEGVEVDAWPKVQKVCISVPFELVFHTTPFRSTSHTPKRRVVFKDSARYPTKHMEDIVLSDNHVPVASCGTCCSHDGFRHSAAAQLAARSNRPPALTGISVSALLYLLAISTPPERGFDSITWSW